LLRPPSSRIFRDGEGGPQPQGGFFVVRLARRGRLEGPHSIERETAHYSVFHLDVVRTFMSALSGRPEGLHYTGVKNAL
jgi:hypothetical protein